MITIYKYPLELRDGQQTFDVPGAYRVIHVGMQRHVLTVWLEIDKTQPERLAGFDVVPTGGNIPPGTTHVGTAIAEPFVWHVYG